MSTSCNAASCGTCPSQNCPGSVGEKDRMQGVHPLLQSRLAVLPPVAEVRKKMQAAIAAHHQRHAAWRKERHSGDQQREAAATGHAPLQLITTTTGTGKTSAMLAAQAETELHTVHVADRKVDADSATNRYPAIFRRRAHENAPDQANNCARVAPKGGVLGRREDGSAILMPDNWANIIEGDLIIRKLAKNMQSVGGNLCPTCPKGILNAIHNPKSRYTPYQKKRLKKFIDRYFSAEEQRCIFDAMCWLDENKLAMQLPHISITMAGLGPSDTEYNGPFGHGNRGLDVDETRPGVMGEVLVLTFADIGRALDDINDHRIRAISEKTDLISRLHQAKTVKGENEMRERVDQLVLDVEYSRRCEGTYKRLHESLLAQPEQDNEGRDVPADMREAIAEFRASTAKRHVAPHEKPSWTSLAEIRRLPMRLIDLVAESIERGSASILPGRRLCIAIPSQLYRIIEEGDHPADLADATPDQTLRDIIQAKGDQVTILDLKARQQLICLYDYRRYRGTGPRRDRYGTPIVQTKEMRIAEARRKLREAAHTETLTALFCKENGIEENHAPWTHIGNRQEMIPLLSVISRTSLDDLDKMHETELRNLASEHRVGWNGLHDRAHDEWTGYNQHQWGDPALPDQDAAMMYIAHRALRIHAGLSALPHYRDEWIPARQHRVEMNGNDVEVPRRVHAVTEVRDFIQAYKDNIQIQTNGRGRATNSNNILFVAKHGGTPNAALDAHGIPAFPMPLDPSPTDRDRKAQERQNAFTRIDLVMTELVRDGKDVTRDNLNQYQRETGQPQTAPGTYAQWLADPHRVMPFAEHLARTGRGAQYAKHLRRALARGREDIGERNIEQRIEEVRQAQISKGGVVTDETVLHGMLTDARNLYESSDILDRLAGEVVTSVLTGDGSVYYTSPPATAPPAAA